MRISYRIAFLVITSLGLSTSASASDPGYLFMDASVRSLADEVYLIRYDFAFRLPPGSNGIDPASEEVVIEVLGEPNPYGSGGSSFVIRISPGSFLESQNHIFTTWNPDGLRASQDHEDFNWDFISPDSVKRYFWARIRSPEGTKTGNMRIWMWIFDNRDDAKAERPSPGMLDLLFGDMLLFIGEDQWQSQVGRVRFRDDAYRPYTWW